MREKIKEIVMGSLKEYNDETDKPLDLSEDEKIRLYGGGGAIDSINLVGLVVSVEEALEDEFDVSIALANEKAMSRRVSPFASVETLIDYIEELLSEGGK